SSPRSRKSGAPKSQPSFLNRVTTLLIPRLSGPILRLISPWIALAICSITPGSLCCLSIVSLALTIQRCYICLLHWRVTTMPKYVIEREIPGAGSLKPEELQAISQKSCGVLKNLGPQIQWLESYVTQDK